MLPDSAPALHLPSFCNWLLRLRAYPYRLEGLRRRRVLLPELQLPSWLVGHRACMVAERRRAVLFPLAGTPDLGAAARGTKGRDSHRDRLHRAGSSVSRGRQAGTHSDVRASRRTDVSKPDGRAHVRMPDCGARGKSRIRTLLPENLAFWLVLRGLYVRNLAPSRHDRRHRLPLQHRTHARGDLDGGDD